MEKEVQVAIVGSLTTVLAAALGWLFAWFMQRESKARERQRNWIRALENEVRARMEEEKVANEWLGELLNRRSQSVTLEVRKRTEEQSDVRPQMSPRDLISGRTVDHR